MSTTEGGTMSHTPEPWAAFVEPQDDGEIRVIARQPYGGTGSFHVAVCNTKADADRIAGCVNGCAGLTPEAYREVVETAQDLLRHLMALENQERLVSDAYTNTLRRALDEAVQHALAHAQAAERNPHVA